MGIRAFHGTFAVCLPCTYLRGIGTVVPSATMLNGSAVPARSSLFWHEDGKLRRKTAKTEKWDVACDTARRLEEQFEAEATGRKPRPRETVTIERAVSAFLADKKSQGLAHVTLQKLTHWFQRQLLSWCDENGIRDLYELDLTRLREWRATWKDCALTKQKKQERVRGFFSFCQSSGWIRDNPAKGLSRIKVIHRPTLYFNEDEMTRIIQATYEIEGGERLRALTLLMRWSGLAIRDAVTLERFRLNALNQISLYRAKTGTPVHVTIPDDVGETLRKLPSENPRYFFWTGNGNPKSAVSMYQRAFRRLFKQADLRHEDGTPKRCFPHMFRDTFAVEYLLVGVAMHDIAMMLGHTSIKTTEKHYAPFVMARMEQIDANVKLAWGYKEVRI